MTRQRLRMKTAPGSLDVVIAALDDSRTRMEKDLRKQQQNEFDDKAFWSPPPLGT